MKNNLFVKTTVLFLTLSTGVMISSCKKEVPDFGLCDKNVGSPFDNGKVKAKTENDADYVRGTTAANALGYADGKAQGLQAAYSAGYTVGHTRGYNETYPTGYAAGSGPGHLDGAEDGYYYGDIDGYNDGYLLGLVDGYDDGYDDGYAWGSCGNGREVPVKPTDDACFNKGYTEVRNAQASYNSGYNTALAANVEYQRGYNEWKNDLASYNRGDADGYPVGRVDGYNQGYKKGYSVAYNASYDRAYDQAYDNSWYYGYDDGYDSGYYEGYDDGRDDACVGNRTSNLHYRNSNEYKSNLTAKQKATSPNTPYRAIPTSVNKLYAGLGGKLSSLKGHASLSAAKVSARRAAAAAKAWNKKNLGAFNMVISPEGKYLLKTRK